MPAIDFPNAPTNGQQFSASGRTWAWNNTLGVWETVSQIDEIIQQLDAKASIEQLNTKASTGKAIAMSIVFGG